MHAIRDAIKDLVTQPCVIADHCAVYALEGRREAVRVLLCADRARREQWLDDLRPAGTHDSVRSLDELDRAERIYVRQAHGRHWPDFRIYHLVIDVGRLPLDCGARLVAEYVGSISTNKVDAP